MLKQKDDHGLGGHFVRGIGESDALVGAFASSSTHLVMSALELLLARALQALLGRESLQDR